MERGQRLEYDDECVEAGEEFELALLTPEGARTVQMAEKLLRQKGFEKKNKIAMSHFKRWFQLLYFTIVHGFHTLP